VFGELLLEDAETGEKRTVECSPESATAYERNFSEFCARLQKLVVRNGGRYARAVTNISYEEFVLRGLRRSRVVA
jgi:ABC-type Zn uptake system ZnuABC Zn-binding protein ZnuA